MVPAWVTRRPSLTEPRPERPRALQSSGHPGVSTRLINFRYYLRVRVHGQSKINRILLSNGVVDAAEDYTLVAAPSSQTGLWYISGNPYVSVLQF